MSNVQPIDVDLTTRRRGSWWKMGLFLFTILGAGCNTPVIPIPPPPLETLELELTDPVENKIAIIGDANPDTSGMLIFLFNLRSGEGNITTAKADGSFRTEPIQVQDKDRLDIWAALEAEDPSDSLCLELDLNNSRLSACQ